MTLKHANAPLRRRRAPVDLGPLDFEQVKRNEYVNRKAVELEEADDCVCGAEGDCGESCLNRAMHIECTSGVCLAGEQCLNQRLQKCEYPSLELARYGAKGMGVRAGERIRAGALVIEYVGEVCSLEESEARAQLYEEANMKDTYIMNLGSKEVIDATVRGNLSRFINHSCNPNGRCEKWSVQGEPCIAIFAQTDIQPGEEITYDYHLDWNGGRRVKCCCGAGNCVGYLGAKSALWKATYNSDDVSTSSTESSEISVQGLPASTVAQSMAMNWSTAQSSWLPSPRSNSHGFGELIAEFSRSQVVYEKKPSLRMVGLKAGAISLRKAARASGRRLEQMSDQGLPVIANKKWNTSGIFRGRLGVKGVHRIEVQCATLSLSSTLGLHQEVSVSKKNLSGCSISEPHGACESLQIHPERVKGAETGLNESSTPTCHKNEQTTTGSKNGLSAYPIIEAGQEITGTPGGEECKHVPGNTCKRSLVSERMDPFRNNIEGRFTVSGPASEMTLQQTSLTKLSSFDLLGGSSPVAPASSNKIHGKEVCQSSSQVDEQDLCQSATVVAESVVSDDGDVDGDANEMPEHSAAEGVHQLGSQDALIFSVHEVCSTDASLARSSSELVCRAHQPAVSISAKENTSMLQESLLEDLSMESGALAQCGIPITKPQADVLHQECMTSQDHAEKASVFIPRAFGTDTVAGSDKGSMQTSGILDIVQEPSTSGGSGSLAPSTPYANTLPRPQMKPSEVAVAAFSLEHQSSCSSLKRGLHERNESCAKRRKASCDTVLASELGNVCHGEPVMDMSDSQIFHKEKQKSQLNLDELPCLVNLSSLQTRGKKQYRGMKKVMKRRGNKQFSHVDRLDRTLLSTPYKCKGGINRSCKVLDTANQSRGHPYPNICFPGVLDPCIRSLQTQWIPDHWVGPSFLNGISQNDKNMHEIGAMNRNVIRNKVGFSQTDVSPRRIDKHLRHFPTSRTLDSSQLAPATKLYNSRADRDTLAASLHQSNRWNSAFQATSLYNIGGGSSECGQGMTGYELQFPNRDNSLQIGEFPDALGPTLLSGTVGEQPHIVFNSEIKHTPCFQHGAEVAYPEPWFKQSYLSSYSEHPPWGASCQFSQAQIAWAPQRCGALDHRYLSDITYDSGSNTRDIQRTKVGPDKLRQAQKILGIIRELAQEESIYRNI